MENFTLFEAKGGTKKLLAKNHQFLGVNKAIAAAQQIKANQGKLGVFWHTQGSGKSYSMVFFSPEGSAESSRQLDVPDRHRPGRPGRPDLPELRSTGAVIEDEKAVRAQSGENLKQLLNAEDHRYIFTLIQKFRTETGEKYPKLSDRSDIIVMTDEAHRSQYDMFALNMRNALPNAAFIGFTGTPLMAGEERTKEVFGDYVSIYNFKQSIEDGNTVPLYYENRIPELQLTNENLNEDMARIIDEAELDEDQEAKAGAGVRQRIPPDHARRPAGEDRRRPRGALHGPGRAGGKAMVISIDKATAVRMYDKVQKHWKAALAELEAELLPPIRWTSRNWKNDSSSSEETDMAVVVSQSQNEIEEFKKKGLDIASTANGWSRKTLRRKFKNPDDPLRLVFVCAMWMTGFDVPSCSTIYLDKPMKNHTLMQTIARAKSGVGEKNRMA